MSTQPDFTLARNAFGRLVLTLADGTSHAGVVPVRAFPIAAPEEGVSLVGEGGRELAWIERLDALPGDARALLQEEFSSREFVPVIRRLFSVSTFSTPSVWTVETDRGTTQFTLAGEEDIRRLTRTSLLIMAANGVHFRVPDTAALDRASRRLIERFL
jgi:hypothetical protein